MASVKRALSESASICVTKVGHTGKDGHEKREKAREHNLTIFLL
jgi:hypothetical protein